MFQYVTQEDLLNILGIVPDLDQQPDNPQLSDKVFRAIKYASMRVNSICGNRIEETGFENLIDTPTFPQKDLVKHATCIMVDYFLSNGVDFSRTSTSISGGNINISTSPPEEPDYVPQEVYNLLQQANLYIPRQTLEQNLGCCDGGRNRIRYEGDYFIDNAEFPITWYQLWANFLQFDTLTSDGSIDIIEKILPNGKKTLELSLDNPSELDQGDAISIKDNKINVVVEPNSCIKIKHDTTSGGAVGLEINNLDNDVDLINDNDGLRGIFSQAGNNKINAKQDKLIAGNNIKIENNVISSENNNIGFDSLDQKQNVIDNNNRLKVVNNELILEPNTATSNQELALIPRIELTKGLLKKQDTLTTGRLISISNNVISSSAAEIGFDSQNQKATLIKAATDFNDFIILEPIEGQFLASLRDNNLTALDFSDVLLTGVKTPISNNHPVNKLYCDLKQPKLVNSDTNTIGTDNKVNAVLTATGTTAQQLLRTNTYSQLTTENKSIVGAINELNKGDEWSEIGNWNPQTGNLMANLESGRVYRFTVNWDENFDGPNTTGKYVTFLYGGESTISLETHIYNLTILLAVLNITKVDIEARSTGVYRVVTGTTNKCRIGALQIRNFY